MEKLWNIVKVTVAVLITLFIIASGTLYHLSGKAEKNLQKAYAYSGSSEWDSALSSVEKIPYYKNASELYSYIYPIKMYYEEHETLEQTMKSYEDILFYINVERETIKKLGDEKYLKDISDLEKVIAFKTNIFNIKSQDESQKNNLNESVELLKQGNFDGALEKLHSMGNGIYDVEKGELIKFAGFLKATQTGDKKIIMPEAAKLDPSYAGLYSTEIKQAVQAYADIETWTGLYANALPPIKQVKPDPSAAEVQPASPQINGINLTVGTKKEDLVAVFGMPSSENTIESRFGVFCEMVYGNRIVYLEDNKVVVVK